VKFEFAESDSPIPTRGGPVAVGSTRERILDCAIDFFGTKGVDAVSLDEIARHVGVRKQTVLYWFASKDDLVDGVPRMNSDPPLLVPVAELLRHEELVTFEGYRFDDTPQNRERWRGWLRWRRPPRATTPRPQASSARRWRSG